MIEGASASPPVQRTSAEPARASSPRHDGSAKAFRETMARQETKYAQPGGKTKMLAKAPALADGAVTPVALFPFPAQPVEAWQGKPRQPTHDAGIPAPPAPAAQSEAPKQTPERHPATAEAASFRTLTDRLDAGTPGSSRSILQFTGEDWRVAQVVLDQHHNGLSVSVDLGQRHQDGSATLEELRRRLNARGLVGEVTEAG